ncbi:MAG: RluA family pseudouridine synthase [Anaerolineales bacterium]|nr:RluA family pseudouridine synthase [Anaerolineales bacterium]
MPSTEIVVGELEHPLRLDQYLRRRFPTWGRQAVQQLIGARQVSVNDRIVWLSSWQVNRGDHIRLARRPEEKPAGVFAMEAAWLIAVEEQLLAVNKPAGLLSEAPPHRQAPNLCDLVAAEFGPVTLAHRLDRDTSGVVLLARTPTARKMLSHAFQGRLVEKEYVAVVSAPNRLDPTGTIDTFLAPDPRRSDHMCVVARGGQRAITRYRVLAPQGGFQVVVLWPATGRTHQLRVQLAHMGAPIVGDRIYGQRSAQRLMLHARELRLPATEAGSQRIFVAPLPGEFQEFCEIPRHEWSPRTHPAACRQSMALGGWGTYRGIAGCNCVCGWVTAGGAL